MAQESPEDKAIRVVCAENLHQSLWLPETSSHPKLQVTFSTTTNFKDADLPAALFIGPMFGTRWMSLLIDKVARDCDVRVICVDRPAFGGSTPVQIENRMNTWLETVPVLLARLGVKHVAIVTHSAGTIYTLNTLTHYRSILHPENPYVAFLAPWVPTHHSGVKLVTAASNLPTGVMNYWSGLNKFIRKSIVPGASWSGAILSQAAGLFTSSASTDLPGGAASASSSTPVVETYGYDDATAKTIEKLSWKWSLEENASGANDELKFCLKKCEDAAWIDVADYAGCIRKIAANEAAILREGNSTARKLRVEAFFAGSDILIGKGGQKFFEQCWQSEEVRTSVDFATSTFKDADHDSVLIDLKKGAFKLILEAIAETGRGRSIAEA